MAIQALEDWSDLGAMPVIVSKASLPSFQSTVLRASLVSTLTDLTAGTRATGAFYISTSQTAAGSVSSYYAS